MRANTLGTPGQPALEVMRLFGGNFQADMDVNQAFGYTWMNFQATTPSSRGSVRVRGNWTASFSKSFLTPLSSFQVDGDLNIGTWTLECTDIAGPFTVGGAVTGDIIITGATQIDIGSYRRGSLVGQGGFDFVPVGSPIVRIHGDVGGIGDIAVICVGPDTKTTINGTVHSDAFVFANRGFNAATAEIAIGGALDGVCIIVDETAAELNPALHAQVIINANANGPRPGGLAWWNGTVRLVDENINIIDLEEGYFPPNADLGGGSIGQVPYDLHPTSSNPLDRLTYPTTSVGVLTSRFNGTLTPIQDVLMELFGPLTLAQGTQPALRVTLMNRTTPTVPLTDVSRFVTVERDASNHRVLRMRAMDGNALPSGIYRVRPNLDNQRVRCAGLITSTPTDVFNFEYEFELIADCNSDGIPDGSNCGGTNLCDPIDFNNDGVFPDSTDIDDYLSVFGGGACSTNDCNDIDFNNDFVSPDSGDTEAFLRVYGGGSC